MPATGLWINDYYIKMLLADCVSGTALEAVEEI